MNISLPPELKASVEARVRSGMYGNASDVVRAGLRALAREELGGSVEQFERILAGLPDEPLTAKIEEEIEQELRRIRVVSRRVGRK